MSNSEKNHKKLLLLERFLNNEMNDEEKERFFELLLEEPRLFRLLKSNALIRKASKKESSHPDTYPASDESDDSTESGNVEEPVLDCVKSPDVLYADSNSKASKNATSKHAFSEEASPPQKKYRSANHPESNSVDVAEKTPVLYSIPRRYAATLLSLAVAATLLLVLQFGYFNNQSEEFPWAIDHIDLVQLADPNTLRSLEQNTTEHDIILSEANILALSGDTSQAMEMYEQLSEVPLFSHVANFNLGILNFNKGDYEKAATCFELASCADLHSEALAEACFWYKTLSHLNNGDNNRALAQAQNTVNMQGVYKTTATELASWLQSH